MDRTNCPSREVLVAFSAGRLSLEEHRVVSAHALVCESCKEIILAAEGVQTFPGATLRADVRRTRISTRIALFSGLPAAVLLTLLWYWPPQKQRSEMAAVVAAAARLDSRPSITRLSADFPYREPKPLVRGSVADAAVERGIADVWSVIARLQNEGVPSPIERRHALAVSYLLVGKVKPAIDTLEEAVRSETAIRGDLADAIRRCGDAALLNDLAVAYMARGERTGDRSRQALALEAAQRAWNLQKTPQIAWTRAVVIELHHVREVSAAAWRDYLALDSRSPWSEPARQRLRDLLQPTDRELWPAARERLLVCGNDDSELLRSVDRFRQDVRLWCEDELLPQWGAAVLKSDASAETRLAKIAALAHALELASGEREVAGAVEAIRRADSSLLRRLAEGHIAYGASRLADRSSKVAESIREMDAAVAALTPESTPFAWRARTEHAGMVYLSNDYKRGLAELRQLPIEDATRISNSCRGEVEALFGAIALQTGSYNEAVNHFGRGVEAFRSAGEKNFEAALLCRMADAYDRAGDAGRAGSFMERSLQLADGTGDPRRRHEALIVAALGALGTDHQAVADLYFEALVASDMVAAMHDKACSSLMWRSAYRYRRGSVDAARSDLAAADQICRSIDDASVRERLTANLELATSVIGSEELSARSVTGLDEAIAYYQKTNNALWLRSAYFARARRLARGDEIAAAERDFLAALRESDAGRDKIDERQLRLSFTATDDEITDGYVEFLLQQHRERDAFELADRRRMRELVNSKTARWRAPNASSTLRNIQASLPLDATLIEYRVLDKSIVAWCVTFDAFTTIRLPVSMRELEPAIAALESPKEEAVLRANASSLYDALVRPIEALLKDRKSAVFVADDDLERIPFGALYDHVRQKALLETCATVVAPSARLFAQSSQRWSERSRRDEHAVIVKAVSAGPNTAALPDAEAEAAFIAGFYPRSRVIDGTAAGASLLRGLGDASMLQFVGHTVIDAEASSRTLRLGEGQQSRIGMDAVVGAAFPKLRLVYLSACETDRGPVLKSEGSLSLARSFFAAGVPTVIGSLWPISDEAARLAARTFHERLHAGDTPAESLRQAQLSLRANGWRFRDWATLRIIGAGI